jgi:hypothetical protein
MTFAPFLRRGVSGSPAELCDAYAALREKSRDLLRKPAEKIISELVFISAM